MSCPATLSHKHAGYLDIEDPWEKGTILVFRDWLWSRVVEVNLADGVCVIERPADFSNVVVPIAEWNSLPDGLGASVIRYITPHQAAGITGPDISTFYECTFGSGYRGPSEALSSILRPASRKELDALAADESSRKSSSGKFRSTPLQFIRKFGRLSKRGRL